MAVVWLTIWYSCLFLYALSYFIRFSLTVSCISSYFFISLNETLMLFCSVDTPGTLFFLLLILGSSILIYGYFSEDFTIAFFGFFTISGVDLTSYSTFIWKELGSKWIKELLFAFSSQGEKMSSLRSFMRSYFIFPE